MSLAKNLGKLKQWTNEKLGSVSKTDFTQEFRDLEKRTETRREVMEKMAMIAEQYVATHEPKAIGGIVATASAVAGAEAKQIPLAALGASMLHLGTMLGDESMFGHDLVVTGEALDKVGAWQNAFVNRMHTNYLSILEEYVGESKKYSELRRKLESRRLDYDAKLNKMQKAKKEKPELEEEVRAAQYKYEETLHDLEGKMAYLLDFEDRGRSSIHELVSAQVEYFTKCTDMLTALQANLAGMAPPPPRSTHTSAASLARTSTPPRIPPPSPAAARQHHSRQNSVASIGRIGAPPPPPARRGSAAPPTEHVEPEREPEPVVELAEDTVVPKPVHEPEPEPIAVTAVPPPSLPARGGAAADGRRLVRVTFDFDGESDQELTLRRGQVVAVLDEIDSGWWIGECNGARGMFPANYTEPITDNPAPAPPSAAVAMHGTGPRIPTTLPTAISAVPTHSTGPRAPSTVAQHSTGSSRTPPFAPTTASNLRAAASAGGTTRPLSTSSLAGAAMSYAAAHPQQALHAAQTAAHVAAAHPQAAAAALGHVRRASAQSSPSTAKPSSGMPVSASWSHGLSAVAAASAGGGKPGPCTTCGCDEYVENVFKRGKCQNCFHAH
ncbi:hypothetical protein AMAG_00145 [Allomyces macrogynus ATCC 38327]|uniref:BAR domain-containing protein n=1 Tax=Allomyces macrogynus (strain ATCC 38327) TaxID=578462 RepID=A0A0L0RUS0_ALLM3|nr:hypothetical protein AMAG_00145 [Allomyces macrogynus ATCC 38327]|eukprot:KNE54147.1 hypothetical protein AMAG_00145 [Allomyces macrogynus ATCC 38327]